MSSFSPSSPHAPLKPHSDLLSSIPADESDLFPTSITQGYFTLFKSHLKALQWQQMPRAYTAPIHFLLSHAAAPQLLFRRIGIICLIEILHLQ